jgi:S1-C subfamily serine protease
MRLRSFSCWSREPRRGLSPAASAGMTGGAVITAVNGKAVGSFDDLASILSRFRPGDTISVTRVSPSGQRTTRSLHLAAGPPQ